MRFALPALVMLALAAPAAAQDAPAPEVDQPITLRMNAMEQNAAATQAIGAILKGEAEFEPRVVSEAFRMMYAVALGFGHLFPEGSQEGFDTRAAPAIWSERQAFDEAVQAYIDDARAAVGTEISGVDQLQPVFGEVTANCRSCHERFRLSDD